MLIVKSKDLTPNMCDPQYVTPNMPDPQYAT